MNSVGTIAKSGALVYSSAEEAVPVDPDCPAIRAKADPAICDAKDKFHAPGEPYDGLPRVWSRDSEDRLSWILFRSLERAGATGTFARWCFPRWKGAAGVPRNTCYWGRTADHFEMEPEIRAALAELEPAQERLQARPMKTGVMLRLDSGLIAVESKLHPRHGKTGWEKVGANLPSRQYHGPLTRLLKPEHRFLWPDLLKRYYQPFRRLMLAARLEHDLDRIALLLIVSRRQEPLYHTLFSELRAVMRLSPHQIELRTWKDVANWLKPRSDNEYLGIASSALASSPLLSRRPRLI